MPGFNLNNRNDDIDPTEAIAKRVRLIQGGKVVVEGVLVAADSTRPAMWVKIKHDDGAAQKHTGPARVDLV